MKSAQQRAESAVNSLLKSPKLGWVQCFSHEKTEAASIILRETGLEGLVECALFLERRIQVYRRSCAVYAEPEVKAVLDEMESLLSKITAPEA